VIDEYGDAIGLVWVLAVERLPERRRDRGGRTQAAKRSPVPLALDADEILRRSPRWPATRCTGRPSRAPGDWWARCR
jgi:hypothetical protein